MLRNPQNLSPEKSWLATAALVLGMAAVAATAFAQETTREEARAALQAKKAAELHPYEPTKIERRIERIGNLLDANRGQIYPFIGSVYSGGGFALGVGHTSRFGDTGQFDARIARSVRSFQMAEGTLKLPTFANNRIRVELNASWLDAPKVAFYANGNESLKGDRSNLFYKKTAVGVSTKLQAARFLTVGAGLDAIKMETGAADVAFAAEKPFFRKSSVFAEFDWRQSPGYTSRGGLYRVEFSDYRQTNAGAHSFNRVDAEVQQLVPILRENSVIALRALASTTNVADGESVPYALLPDLGGSHTLRGYPSWRFRDRNRVALTGEYRWKAGHFLDMALFVDAGQVAPRFASLDLGEFKKTYGLGMSFHTPVSTVTRIEVARTSEGTALVFSFSPSF